MRAVVAAPLLLGHVIRAVAGLTDLVPIGLQVGPRLLDHAAEEPAGAVEVEPREAVAGDVLTCQELLLDELLDAFAAPVVAAHLLPLLLLLGRELLEVDALRPHEELVGDAGRTHAVLLHLEDAVSGLLRDVQVGVGIGVVLDGVRAGEHASLGDLTDEEHRDVVRVAVAVEQLDQLLEELAAGEFPVLELLDRVDEEDLDPVLLDVGDELLDVGEVRESEATLDAQAVGPHLDHPLALFAGVVEHRLLLAGREAVGELEGDRRLAGARDAGEEVACAGKDAGKLSATEHLVDDLDAGQDAPIEAVRHADVAEDVDVGLVRLGIELGKGLAVVQRSCRDESLGDEDLRLRNDDLRNFLLRRRVVDLVFLLFCSVNRHSAHVHLVSLHHWRKKIITLYSH